MILGGIPGYTSNIKPGENVRKQGSTTFNYDLRLNFDTSYTGQDLLRTRLRTGNFSALPFGSSSQPFKLDKAESYNNVVFLDRLYYQFPVGKDKSIKLTAGALVRNTEMVWLPTAYKSDVLDVFTTIGTTGTYNKATGQGFGFQWKQKVEKGKGAFLVNTNYVVSRNDCFKGNSDAGSFGACEGSNVGASGADSAYGVFNSKSGLNWLSQIGYQAPNWGAAIGYRYGTEGTNIRDGNGRAATTLLPKQYSSSIALNGYWQPIKTGWFPSISAGYGYNWVDGVDLTAGNASSLTRNSASWFAGLQWDNAFIKGNAAGVAFGQPSFSNTPAQSDPWLIEWFYRFQVSDNISVTPTLFYGTGISNTRSNTSGGGSGQALTGTTFQGLGGVIQTTFKF
jgi:hypothetical protein